MVNAAAGIAIGVAVFSIVILIILLALYFTGTPPFSNQAPPPEGGVVY